jgi:hypothetical protein
MEKIYQTAKEITLHSHAMKRLGTCDSGNYEIAKEMTRHPHAMKRLGICNSGK